MFFLRELPSPECFDRLQARYPEMDQRALCALIALIRTSADITECFEKFLAKHGLSHGRFAIMMFLNRDPDQSVNQTQLAEAYGVSKATITGLIDGLERDSMVERLPDPNDRRATLVRLAPAGQAFLSSFLPAHFRGIAELMAGLKPKELEQLKELLGTIGEGIGRISAASPSCGCISQPGPR